MSRPADRPITLAHNTALGAELRPIRRRNSASERPAESRLESFLTVSSGKEKNLCRMNLSTNSWKGGGSAQLKAAASHILFQAVFYIHIIRIIIFIFLQF